MRDNKYTLLLGCIQIFRDLSEVYIRSIKSLLLFSCVQFLRALSETYEWYVE